MQRVHSRLAFQAQSDCMAAIRVSQGERNLLAAHLWVYRSMNKSLYHVVNG